MPDPTIPVDQYAARRKAFRRRLKKSAAVIFAGEHDAHLPTPFRPHPHFEYLTGVTDEPGAVLLLDPAAPVESRRDVLFLRPLNPEVEKWDGYRLELSAALRERTGFKAVMRHSHLPRAVNEAVRRHRSVACVHPFSQYDQDVSPDLALFQKVAERIPGVTIEDKTDDLAEMRSVKSRDEIAMIQRAVEITGLGFEAAMQSVKPGQTEFDVQETVEHAYRTHGSRGPAFGTIAGAGLNSTVLHYHANDAVIGKGDLICIDSGASYGGYGGDITRTIPANGKFTKRQREVYDIVLDAMNAAIRAVKPGTTLAQIDRVARAIITKAGYGDCFIHSIGHHLGLETHDTAPSGPLKEGAVVTIEPGIYIADEKIGIRIEDDVVVTRTGSKNLATGIPKTADDIEAAMRPTGRRKRAKG